MRYGCRGPSEPGLIARRIGHFGFSLYGAPSYLKETPPHAFTFIAYDTSMEEAPQQQWLKTIAGNRDIVLRTSDLGKSGSGGACGLGLAALPHFLGDSDPRLERYESGEKEVGRDVWLAGSPRPSPRARGSRRHGVPGELPEIVLI